VVKKTNVSPMRMETAHPDGTRYNVGIEAEVRDGARLGVRRFTLIERVDGEVLEPKDMDFLAAHVDHMLREMVGALLGVDASELWREHLESVVPKLPGQNKGQWIARVWRNYYEPSGRTLVELAADLGLSHETVRGYASRFDPTRETK
jgi:hypothetical protein